VKKKFKYLSPVVLWAVVIFCFSALSQTKTVEVYWQDFVLKKTAHVVEYGILAMLLYRFYINSGKSKKRSIAYSLILTVLYAATDEIHQSYVPGREPRVRDVFFDTLGASLTLYWINKVLPKAGDRVKYYARKLELI